MFKSVGNIFQGVNSIAEGARKKREGKKLIELAKARARNAEQKDYTNNSAMIKVSGKANENALESINLNATEGFSQASDAGIRGIGMIGKIQQNVNDAIRKNEKDMADKEFAVQQMKAEEQSSLQGDKNAEINRQEGRTDAMSERGQALRSQGSAEVGQGASQTGGALDAGIKSAIAMGSAGGGLLGKIGAGIDADNSTGQSLRAPGLSTNPFSNMFKFKTPPKLNLGTNNYNLG